MQKVLGVIFAESHYANIHELTTVRPLGALPFGGRYRMIDFTLSNMVNSGMINVAVVTQNNYHSLMGHIGSGKPWNLARHRYGVTLFPPFSNLSSSGSDSRIDILYGVLDFFKRSSQTHVLLSESNILSNTLLNDIYDKHLASKADISIVYKEVDGNEFLGEETYITTDEDDNVLALDIGENISGTNKKYIGYVLADKQVLINIIEHSKIRGKKGYLANLITRNIGKLNIKAIKLDGYAKLLFNIKEYYDASMEILDKDIRANLFNSEHPIYTKDKNTPPTRYEKGAKVVNSFVADGCVIEGDVKNSIISRSAIIKKGAVVEDSIIMQSCEIGENVHLKNVILDKKCIIRDNKELVGEKEYLVVVSKGKII